jgi:hypothetical protein
VRRLDARAPQRLVARRAQDLRNAADHLDAVATAAAGRQRGGQ